MLSYHKRGAIGAWLLVIGAIIACVAGYMAVKVLTRTPESAKLEEKRAVVNVGTAPAAYVNVSEKIEINGTVDARDRLKVSAEVGGLKIVDVRVEEGDLVRKGQVMAVLNTDITEAKLAQLQARRDQQVAALSKARQPDRPLEISQLESAVQQAQSMVQQEQSNYTLVQAALSNAQQNLSRYTNLYGQGAVAQTEAENRKLEVDRQKAQLQSAKDRIEGAKFAVQQARERVQLARQGGRSEDIAIVEAQIRELDAQIQEVRVIIEQGQIKAPTDGWVLKRDARLGDVSGAGTVLFEMAKNSELELLGQLPATILDKVSVGQSVQVIHGGKTIQASVWKLSPIVNAENRNAEIRIALPPNSGLRPGMFAQANIGVGDRKSLTVPQEAVRGETPEFYVFTLKGNEVQRQDVAIDGRQDGLVQVIKGLSAGQEVVIEGGGFLRDGDTISR